MKTEALVEINDITFSWAEHENPILEIKQLHVNKSEHVFIRGDSGSGKTTLLNLLCGIHIAQSGQVSILGKNIGSLNNQDRDRFRGDHLGVIFQQFNLLPFLSVGENIALPCRFSSSRRNKIDNIDIEIMRLLEAVDLPTSIINRSMTELSVGQQQRVAVCRALIGSPELIIADEPTSSLDARNRDRFLDLLFSEADKHNSTIIFVSHDEQITQQFSKIIELAELNVQGVK